MESTPHRGRTGQARTRREQGHGGQVPAEGVEATEAPAVTTWRAFVRAHLAGTIAIDFLVVPAVTFNLLYVFFVLSLEGRQLFPVNVTSHPYAARAVQQIVEATVLMSGSRA
ncbi:MAG TPA: hypothetical protein VG963_31490 [Polyangiaceae bacterium]|nr:hypothetical protein [Polyangiaceae bacterium]